MERNELGPRRDRYSDEDVKGILEHALSNQARNEFSRADLEQMAAQLGISPEQLSRAEAEWFRVPGESLEQLRRQFYLERRGKYLGQLLGIAATFVFLGALIYFRTPLSGIAMAFLFITFFAALGTIQESFEGLFTTSGDEFERGFDEWLEKRKSRRLEPPQERDLLSE